MGPHLLANGCGHLRWVREFAWRQRAVAAILLALTGIQLDGRCVALHHCGGLSSLQVGAGGGRTVKPGADQGLNPGKGAD